MWQEDIRDARFGGIVDHHQIIAHPIPRPVCWACSLAKVARLGGQVFLTGADPAVFAELSGRAEMFEVSAEAGVRPA